MRHPCARPAITVTAITPSQSDATFRVPAIAMRNQVWLGQPPPRACLPGRCWQPVAPAAPRRCQPFSQRLGSSPPSPRPPRTFHVQSRTIQTYNQREVGGLLLLSHAPLPSPVHAGRRLRRQAARPAGPQQRGGHRGPKNTGSARRARPAPTFLRSRIRLAAAGPPNAPNAAPKRFGDTAPGPLRAAD